MMQAKHRFLLGVGVSSRKSVSEKFFIRIFGAFFRDLTKFTKANLLCKTIYIKNLVIMESNETQKQYKRVNRAVSPETKAKISKSLAGKPKTMQHRQAISNSLRADTGGYWSHIQPAPQDDGDGEIGMDDIIL